MFMSSFCKPRTVTFPNNYEYKAGSPIVERFNTEGKEKKGGGLSWMGFFSCLYNKVGNIAWLSITSMIYTYISLVTEDSC